MKADRKELLHALQLTLQMFQETSRPLNPKELGVRLKVIIALRDEYPVY
jgi:hypothetical protein